VKLGGEGEMRDWKEYELQGGGKAIEKKGPIKKEKGGAKSGTSSIFRGGEAPRKTDN